MSALKRPMRVAVIGCGRVGKYHASAIIESSHAELAAVCDVTTAAAEAMAAEFKTESFTDHQCLLDQLKPDLVTIATPDHLHTRIALDAIDQGCHVFCEKPLATDLDSAAQMVRAADEKNVALGVDYNRRYAFGYRRARQLVEAGEIGTLQSSVISVTDKTPSPQVASSPEAMLTTLLTHHIDLMRWFNGEIKEVMATMLAPSGNPRLVRHTALTFKFQSGCLGSVLGNYRDEQSRTSEQMQVVGTSGEILVDDVTGPVRMWRDDPDNIVQFAPNPFCNEHAFWDTIRDHLSDYISSIASGEPPPVTGRDGLQGLRVVAAAFRSHRSGTFEPIDGNLL